MQLGNKSKQQGLAKDEKSFVDPKFFRIQFKINGKVFSKAVDDLLSFEQENLEEISDIELDRALDKVSYWRFSFTAAYAEIEQKLSSIEREFSSFMATATKEIKKEIMINRKQEKEDLGVPNNWFGSVTKQEIEQGIITSPKHFKKYNQYQDTIAEMNKNIRLLKDLRDILEARGGHLQSIGKRRLENNRRFNA